MKIGLVAPYDWTVPGGIQRHILALDRAFRRAGHQVTMIAPCSTNGERAEPLPPNLIPISGTVLPLPTSGSQVRVVLSPRLARQVRQIMAQKRFDVVHLHEPLMPVVCLLALYYARSCPTTLAVGTFHAYRDENIGYEYARPIFHRLMNRLEGRIAVSEAARDTVARYFPGTYRLIPNGVDLSLFGRMDLEPIARFADGRPNILFAGRLEKRKGFNHLLRAFEQVKRAVPAARLIAVGAFNAEQSEPFVRWAEENRLEDVHFVGRVSDEELARYYRTADLVCAPSTGFESFGLVLLEAMAAGCPVVASDIPGYREVVRDGVEGLLVPPGDEGGLAAAVLRLLTDEALRRRLSERGRVRAGFFSWERVAGQILDYYDELLRGGKRS